MSAAEVEDTPIGTDEVGSSEVEDSPPETNEVSLNGVDLFADPEEDFNFTKKILLEVQKVVDKFQKICKLIKISTLSRSKFKEIKERAQALYVRANFYPSHARTQDAPRISLEANANIICPWSRWFPRRANTEQYQCHHNQTG